MVFKQPITFPAFNGYNDRMLHIYLPNSYDAVENSERHYPVIYMFDGHNLFSDSEAAFGKSWGLADYLDRTERQIIVVGISCNTGPDNARLSEYSPFDFTDYMFGKTKGYGKKTFDWLINTLKPYVDQNLRTKPNREHTFLGGSSMGGLMAFYGTMQHNDIFSRCIALSPSIWAGRKSLVKMLHSAKIADNTVVYLDYGNKEINTLRAMQDALGEMAKDLIEKGVLITYRLVPDGTHSEASWERQLPFAFNTLLYNLPD